MLFAAGLGARMGSLTANTPKPLISVQDQTLIDRALVLADTAKIEHIVVNLHYLGDQIVEHLTGRQITYSWERTTLLETGGGLRAALPLLGTGPVFTLNSDAVWTNHFALVQLLAGWDNKKMDALMLLLPVSLANGHKGSGDFVMAADGRLSRAKGVDGMVYLGAQIIATDRLDAVADDVFSLNLIWDQMISDGRIYGTIYNGGWCDVGSPQGLDQANALLAAALDSADV